MGIAVGPEGRIWFTEQAPPGRVARVNGDGTVTELVGGVTPGFSANSTPTGIATGPDGKIWFTQQAAPGRVARVNGDGSVTEFTGGTTPGFSADGTPTGIVAGRDGAIWFTEQAAPGRVTQLATPPEAVTGDAQPLSPTQARVSGTVDPQARATSARAEYRRPGGAFASTSLQQAATGQEGPITLPVTVILSGLAPSATYEYRLVAVNPAGTATGAIRTFATPASGARPLGRVSARCAGRRATIVGTRRADRLTGTRRRDVISGLAGDDVIRGLGDRDLVCGGGGRDRLLGGRGADVLRGEAGADRLLRRPGRGSPAGRPRRRPAPRRRRPGPPARGPRQGHAGPVSRRQHTRTASPDCTCLRGRLGQALPRGVSSKIGMWRPARER